MSKSLVSTGFEADQVCKKGWQATLDLRYQALGSRTVLRHGHRGPLRVQRPFYPEGGLNHTYLLHPPGGMVAGDELHITAHVDEQAMALVTTPGAAKVYRSLEGTVLVQQDLCVEGSLEWLPQETILFDDSRILSETKLQFGASGRGVYWDLQCLGRPAGGYPYDQGEGLFKLSVYDGDRPLLLDRLDLRATADLLPAPWGLRSFTTVGVMVAYPVDAAVCERVQTVLQDLPWVHATRLDNLLVVRGLADQAQALRAAFVCAWQALRPALLGRPVFEPRIWAT